MVLLPTGLVHAVDWYPTLVQAAGGSIPPGMDGMAMWQHLRHNLPSPRTEFIYNIDDKNRRSAIGYFLAHSLTDVHSLTDAHSLSLSHSLTRSLMITDAKSIA